MNEGSGDQPPDVTKLREIANMLCKRHKHFVPLPSQLPRPQMEAVQRIMLYIEWRLKTGVFNLQKTYYTGKEESR